MALRYLLWLFAHAQGGPLVDSYSLAGRQLFSRAQEAAAWDLHVVGFYLECRWQRCCDRLKEQIRELMRFNV
ncbi:hypothetical protein BCR34DRAFT_579537 [Clohesyomyces aquaticus]|uniref:Fungal-type protein kinase domain-containing protein n=1 Tax=Clohesyomyces aquaticus TaxID=1231657 RepID=A0A1Y1YAS4_9PLEO|nr:hypothetical protein BCR34DRAFT_579537 [Clohesyomyces aquaticus]